MSRPGSPPWDTDSLTPAFLQNKRTELLKFPVSSKGLHALVIVAFGMGEDTIRVRVECCLQLLLSCLGANEIRVHIVVEKGRNVRFSHFVRRTDSDIHNLGNEETGPVCEAYPLCCLQWDPSQPIDIRDM